LRKVETKKLKKPYNDDFYLNATAGKARYIISDLVLSHPARACPSSFPIISHIFALKRAIRAEGDEKKRSANTEYLRRKMEQWVA